MLVSDSSMAAGPGGCFSGDATVTLSSGQKKTIDNVTIGERVLTYDAQTEQFHYDAVITFLHRRRASNEMIQYLIVETEYGQRLTVTPGTSQYMHDSRCRSIPYTEPLGTANRMGPFAGKYLLYFPYS